MYVIAFNKVKVYCHSINYFVKILFKNCLIKITLYILFKDEFVFKVLYKLPKIQQTNYRNMHQLFNDYSYLLFIG